MSNTGSNSFVNTSTDANGDSPISAKREEKYWKKKISLLPSGPVWKSFIDEISRTSGYTSCH